ncbi:MAG: tRNA pseudouridine(38-40) synthase TruA [Tidjanibacter sp.]|nr:tRNA pseudouridine(38-40) synthase TruA [Tidjanibacter sp.]
MRYFVELSYKGTAYNGWQRQPSSPSVEQTIEQAFSTILRAEIDLVGAGRTDTGVHAAHYVAHFDFDQPLPDDFVYHLNALLPQDIAIARIYAVAPNAHARFDAREREYHYYISSVKNPFTRQTSWQLLTPLDLDAMNRAARHLIEVDDFTTFAKLGSDNRTNLCRVVRAEWVTEGAEGIVFIIRADRFLRNMVRAIVGTLVDVGRGKLSVEEFCEAVDAKDLARSSTSAPAQGLFLTDIAYPYSTPTR